MERRGTFLSNITRSSVRLPDADLFLIIPWILVEIFKRKQILPIVSIKRISDNDCEDKNWLNHCLESSIICIKFSIYRVFHSVWGGDMGGCLPPSYHFFQLPPLPHQNRWPHGHTPHLKMKPPNRKNKPPTEKWSTLPWNDSKKKHNN